MDSGADIEAKGGPESKTALHLAVELNTSEAVREKKTEMVEFLLKQGADPNSTRSAGRSPLYVAAKVGSVEAARMLLQHGARLEIETKKKRTPLHAATKNGHLDFVKFFDGSQGRYYSD